MYRSLDSRPRLTSLLLSMLSRPLRFGLLGLGIGCLGGAAWAQPRWERNQDRVEVQRGKAQLKDDMRDLQRFRQTQFDFDNAVARRDTFGVRNALRSFVNQGRMEVQEQQRETAQAMREAQRSQNEAYRDRTWKDRRDAMDDRRDARSEQIELQQETAALNDLERAAAAEYSWGPGPGVIMSARNAMQRFIQLAEIEVRKSHRELQEDRRELREDRPGMRPGYRGGPAGPPPTTGPVYVAPAPARPTPVYVAPAPAPVPTRPVPTYGSPAPGPVPTRPAPTYVPPPPTAPAPAPGPSRQQY